MSTPATYDSRCSYCDRMILEGEPIDEFEGDWLHEECAEEAAE